MATDVFNNPSNDYVNPGLAPCAGIPDGNSGEFKFIDGGAGVVVGSDIVQFIDLSGLSIDVTEWSGRKQTLQSGEVIYVPGPDKGLLNRKQIFEIPTNETDQKYYFIIDLSISYYNNFRHRNINLEASSNYSLNLDIDDALNVALSNKSIKAEAAYIDPSTLAFTGTQLGYDFDISNVVLTLIDASLDSTSPFPAIIIDGERIPQTYDLNEKTLLALPASKYPNGAMLGYVLKADYPSDECYRNWWLYMNHVHSPFDVYIAETITNFLYDIETYKTITFDSAIDASFLNAPLITDLSIGLPDITVDVSVTSESFDPTDASIDVSTGITIDGSIVNWRNIFSSIITDSSITNSNIYDSSTSESYLSNNYFISGEIVDSSILDSGLIMVNIRDSYINPSILDSCDVSLSTATTTLFMDSNLYGVSISDSSIKGGFVGSTEPITFEISTLGLESYYSFNNTLAGNPGNIANYGPSGTPTYVTGKFNNAIFMDTSTHYVSLDFTPSLIDHDFTVAFWFKINDDASTFNDGVLFTSANTGVFSSMTDKIELNMEDGSLGLLLTNNSASEQNWFDNYQDNEWHLVILTYTDTSTSHSYTLYVDNVETPIFNSSTAIDVSVGTHTDRFIGNGIGAGSVVQPGVYDELRLYDRELTINERRGILADGSSLMYHSSLTNVSAEIVNIQYSTIDDLNMNDGSISSSSISNSGLYDVDLYDSSVSGSLITGDPSTTIINNSFISDSSLQYVIAFNSTFEGVSVKDSSISGTTIYNSRIDDSSLAFIDASGLIGQNVHIDAGVLYDSYLEDSVIYDTEVRDSSLLRVIFSVDSSIYNSVIEDTRVNYVEAIPGVWLTDPSTLRMEIFGGTIIDTSIFNTTIYDASIYTSNIDDCSLYRCTIYNTSIDTSSYIDSSSYTFRINSTCDCSVSWETDTSTFYNKYNKVVDVGMSGCGNTTTLSAADYLDYINSNDLWFKVGKFASRFTAPDIPESSQKNLIGGFYLFNPQTFPVNIEYMILNKVEN